MNYQIAIEKMINMIYTIEQTMIYLEDEKIKPDEGVKQILIPLVEKMKNWMDK